MSCVSFLSPQQRLLLRAAPTGPAVSSFRSPEVTEGKVQRLRQMAVSADPRIRESAALAYATPLDVLADLALDPEPGVRCSVARNEHAPAEVLRLLAADPAPGVRGWVAANPGVPLTVLESLTDDPDATVRGVVGWARRWPDAQVTSRRAAPPAAERYGARDRPTR